MIFIIGLSSNYELNNSKYLFHTNPSFIQYNEALEITYSNLSLRVMSVEWCLTWVWFKAVVLLLYNVCINKNVRGLAVIC